VKLLVTGAAGGMGTILRARLPELGYALRLADIVPIVPAGGEEVLTASVTDGDAMRAACQGVDAVVHLGGISVEDRWDAVVDANVNGTHTVLEAGVRAGVSRFVLASSNHAVGFHARSAGPAPDYLFPRPDTYYGVTKVAIEALGSLYHDRFGVDVVCLRIGTCTERPLDERQLATWLSPDDCARLLHACLTVSSPGFRVAWATSANTRAWWSLEGARALGYTPQDNAERFAGDVPAAPDPAALDRVGGVWCTAPLGERGVPVGRR